MAHQVPETLIARLHDVKKNFEELTEKIGTAEVISDIKRLNEISKERSHLESIVEIFEDYQKTLSDYQGALTLAHESNDKEMGEMASLEVKELEPKLDQMVDELKLSLIPQDPNDDKNVMLELRAGVGGDEAGLFVGDMYRAYSRYADKNSWRCELMSSSENSAGGHKEIIANISGERVYSTLKYESGVHRVQRVPKTETQGRVHTSTITVAVLPEAEEVELDIDQNDLRIDVFRAGGNGGQSVNTTDSAVRITYLPTNEVVICQDEKSQLKNKNKAMKVLRSRLLQKMISEKQEAEASQRRAQVGGGFRNERIRTYNFPQGRLTDHRIGLTTHSLDSVMTGDFEDIFGALTRHYQLEALKGSSDA